MKADTLELYRTYTGDETFNRIKHYETVAQMWEDRAAECCARAASNRDSGSPC